VETRGTETVARFPAKAGIQAAVQQRFPLPSAPVSAGKPAEQFGHGEAEEMTTGG
jgi:hypothetical protein